MKNTIACPTCHKSYQVDDTHLGKKLRCRKCAQVFPLVLPPGESESTPPPQAIPAEPMAPPPREAGPPGVLERFRGALAGPRVVSLSAVWLPLGLGWALAHPWTGLLPWGLVLLLNAADVLLATAVGFCVLDAGITPLLSRSSRPRARWLRWLLPAALAGMMLLLHRQAGPLGLAPLLLTGALILANLAQATRVVGRTGHPLQALPMTAMLLLLFPLLFFQICCHLGADHYLWDRAPARADWPVFMLAHTIKAGDLPDLLHAYGVKIQPVQHASLLTTLCLIAYHLIVDLFLVGVVLEVVRTEEHMKRLRLYMGGAAGLFVLLWLPTALFSSQWGWSDLLLWPLDSLVRVVDATDAVELFGLRLHQVHGGWWEATLAAFLRLLLLVLLFGLLARFSQELSLRVFRGWGLGRDELERVRDTHASARVREVAAQRLAWLSAPAEGLPPDDLRQRLLGSVWAGAGAAACVAGAVWLGLGSWGRATPRLVERAVGPEDRPARQALAALERMGRYAEEAAAPLGENYFGLPSGRREAAIRALATMGPPALPVLGEAARNEEEEVGRIAVEGLKSNGAGAAPLLVLALESPWPAVRREARDAILELGYDAVDPLIQTMTQQNEAWHWPFLIQLDPRWYQREADNKHFQELVRFRERTGPLRENALTTLARPGATTQEIGGAAHYLSGVGFLACEAVPDLVRHEQYDALGAAGAAGVPALVRALENRPEKRKDVLRALIRIGPAAADAIPALEDGLRRAGEDETLFAQLSQALGRMGPAALPTLDRLAGDDDPRMRQAAAQALAQMAVLVVELERPRALARTLELVQRTLDDSDADVQRWALAALEQLGPKAAGVKGVLLGRLGDSGLHPEQVERVLDRVAPGWRGGADDRSATLAHLQSPSPTARRHALRHLKQLDTVPPEAVPGLIALLGDGDSQARDEAVALLEKLGPAARAAGPALVQNADRLKYTQVQRALAKIGLAAELRGSLIPVLEKGSRPSRLLALELLTGVGPEGQDLAPALAGCLEAGIRENDESLSLGAMYVLRRIGPGAAAAVPGLIALLPGLSLTTDAEQTLAALKADWKKHPQAALALSRSLADTRGGTRYRAAEMIGELRAAGAPVLPALARCLQDRESFVRRGAITAMGHIGPAAAPWIKEIEPFLKDQDSEIRRAATTALAQIRGRKD